MNLISCSQLLPPQHSGLGTATFLDLPTGDVVANFEGATNATTLTCNVISDQGAQHTTSWSIANFDSSTSAVSRPLTIADTIFSFGGDLIPNTTITYLNQITIVNWTTALDGATLFCGTGQFPEQASVVFKIYSESVHKVFTE